MAIETNQVVIFDGFSEVTGVTGIDFISMGIMAHPAGEFLAVFLGMYTRHKTGIDVLKLELCIFFISSMAINASCNGLHPEVACMGEGAIIFGVAIGTFEFPVV